VSMIKEEFVFGHVFAKYENGKTKSIGMQKIKLLHGFKDQGIIVSDKRPVEKDGKIWIYLDKTAKVEETITISQITFEPEEWVAIRGSVRDKKNRIAGIMKSCQNREQDTERAEKNLELYQRALTKIEMLIPGDLL
jgi:hypothetical protein